MLSLFHCRIADSLLFSSENICDSWFLQRSLCILNHLTLMVNMSSSQLDLGLNLDYVNMSML